MDDLQVGKGGIKLDREKEIDNSEIGKLSDEELLKLTLKPLADPVIEAMFTNEHVAGLAAQSLVNAVLEIDSDPPMGKITRLTTQKTASNILGRGYRLDIEGLSENELSDIEIQITPMNMVNRGFLQASQLAGINAKRGDSMHEVLMKMPRILMINFNWFMDRPKHPDFTQPVDLMYRKPDPITKIYERASDKIHIYNVEITKFIKKVMPGLKSKPYDPKTPRLHYWLWALCESHTCGISLTEVIKLSSVLQEFVKNDSGFEQYAERYEDVCNDLFVRRQFAAWTAEMDKLDIMRAVGKAEGIAEGKAEGIAEGKAEVEQEKRRTEQEKRRAEQAEAEIEKLRQALAELKANQKA